MDFIITYNDNIIRQEFDKMLKDSGCIPNDTECEAMFHIFKAGWKHHEKWYKEHSQTKETT